MAGMSSYTGISGYVQTIYEDALTVARDNMIMPSLTLGFADRQNDAPRTNSLYGTVTFTQVDDTDDLTSQSFNPSTYQTVTVAEQGAQVFITDRRIENDPFGQQADATQELGTSLAAKIEGDLVSKFSSLTGGTIGASGSAATWGQFYAALAIARATNAGGQWAFVCHPYYWYALGTAAAVAGGVSQTNAPQFQDDVMRRFWVGNVAGIDIYTSTFIGTGAASVQGLFHRNAIALDVRRAPRLEVERDASRRGFELNMTAKYGSGIWRPEWGVQVVATVAAPKG